MNHQKINIYEIIIIVVVCCRIARIFNEIREVKTDKTKGKTSEWIIA